MLKKLALKKILIASIALFTLSLIYLIPKEEYVLKGIKEELEYVDSDLNKSEIYLLDSYNMLARTMVITDKKIENKAKELLEILIVDGKGENKIPNGFKSIIPSETKILSISYKDNLLKVDFSEELLNVKPELEEKVVEAIVYTLTSIEEVQKVIIYVKGEILTKLPQTKKNLPTTLDKSFGINKEYNFNELNDITKVTIYYINKNNDNTYYVPVTKYLNDTRDKVHIIVDELSSSNVYNTNLMSYLNSNTELLKVENTNDIMNLSFNNYIYNDLNEKSILEEVIYTIGLSLRDNYNIKEVTFLVDNEEIYKTVLKTIE